MKDENVIDINNEAIEINQYGLLDHFFIGPNEIVQNPKYHPETVRTALYLTSLPKNWIVRPNQIMRHFGYSRWIWNKVSKELREGGYLRVKPGIKAEGKSKGGCTIEFSIIKKFSPKQRLSGILDVKEKRLSGNMTPYKEHTLYKINNNTKQTNNPDDVPDDLLFLTKKGINKKCLAKWLNDFGHDKIIEKAKIVNGLQNCRSYAGALTTALKEDWPANPFKDASNSQFEATEAMLKKQAEYEAEFQRKRASGQIKGWRERKVDELIE